MTANAIMKVSPIPGYVSRQWFGTRYPLSHVCPGHPPPLPSLFLIQYDAPPSLPLPPSRLLSPITFRPVWPWSYVRLALSLTSPCKGTFTYDVLTVGDKKSRQ